MYRKFPSEIVRIGYAGDLPPFYVPGVMKGWVGWLGVRIRCVAGVEEEVQP